MFPRRSTHGLLKLSVGVTSHAYLLEIEGLFTQGSRPGRTLGESVGGIFEMDNFDWSNRIRYHIFDTRPDTEFNLHELLEYIFWRLAFGQVEGLAQHPTVPRTHPLAAALRQLAALTGSE